MGPARRFGVEGVARPPGRSDRLRNTGGGVSNGDPPRAGTGAGLMTEGAGPSFRRRRRRAPAWPIRSAAEYWAGDVEGEPIRAGDAATAVETTRDRRGDHRRNPDRYRLQLE